MKHPIEATGEKNISTASYSMVTDNKCMVYNYLSSEWSKKPSDDCAMTVETKGLITPAA